MKLCGVPIDFLIVSVLATTLRVATPLVLGGISGLYSERSGVVNIAIEGMMLMGAFFAYVAGVISGSLWYGLVAGMLGAALLALLHAWLAITYKVDQIISGTVVNILAVGITTFFADTYFSRNATATSSLGQWAIPFLSDIPVWGRLVIQQPLVWISLMLVILTHFVMYFTRWGLRTRAVGEHPRAADTVGLNVFFMRYVNVLLSGAIAGLGGAYFIAEVT